MVKGYALTIKMKYPARFRFSQNSVCFLLSEIKSIEGNMENLEKEKLRQVLLDALAFGNVGIDIVGLDHKILYQNQFLQDRYGDLSGKLCYKELRGLEKPCEPCFLAEVIENNHPAMYEGRDSQERTYQVIAFPIPDEKKAIEVLLDTTKQTRMRNCLEIVGQIHRVLTREKNELKVFQSVCDLLLKTGRVELAWIGLVEKEALKISPVARAGPENDYLTFVKSAQIDYASGGPVNNALTKRQPVLIRDIAAQYNGDSGLKNLKNRILDMGYVSLYVLPMYADGEVMGIINLCSKRKDAFSQEEIELLEGITQDISLAVRGLRAERRSIVLIDQAVSAISVMTELRDPYTSGHERRVANICRAIGEKLGFSEDQLEGIRIMGFLHDIGKIAIPSEILNKPGKLSEIEFNLVKNHPEIGYEILKKLDFPWPVAAVARQHHERINGSGYLYGIKGREILLEAKILAVADVIEAICSHRPYRPALGVAKALEEIINNKGILYEPIVVDACVRLFQEEKITNIDYFS